jgi:hypothetical protein
VAATVAEHERRQRKAAGASVKSYARGSGGGPSGGREHVRGGSGERTQWQSTRAGSGRPWPAVGGQGARARRQGVHLAAEHEGGWAAGRKHKLQARAAARSGWAGSVRAAAEPQAASGGAQAAERGHGLQARAAVGEQGAEVGRRAAGSMLAAKSVCSGSKERTCWQQGARTRALAAGTGVRTLGSGQLKGRQVAMLERMSRQQQQAAGNRRRAASGGRRQQAGSDSERQ